MLFDTTYGVESRYSLQATTQEEGGERERERVGSE